MTTVKPSSNTTKSPKKAPKTRGVVNVPPPSSWWSPWMHLVMWALIILGLLQFIGAVKAILLPFALGILVAYLLNPLAIRLTRRGSSRATSAAIITLSIVAILVGLLVWLGPMISRQLVEFASHAPKAIHTLENAVDARLAPFMKTVTTITGDDTQGSVSDMGGIMAHTFSAIGDVATNLFASAGTVLNLLALLLITPIVCFYFIRDWPQMLTSMDRLLPRAYAQTIREQLALINQTLASFLRGQLTVMLVLTLFYCIGFAILGVKYALLLGLMAGLFIILPYIGSWISIGLGLVVAYGQFGITTDWWFMVGLYVIGQVLEQQVLVPKVIGESVGLHPLWLLFGMLAGGALLGLLGVLIAVPLTAVISVLVKFAIARYLESSLYNDA